jgi:hypothetical protein
MDSDNRAVAIGIEPITPKEFLCIAVSPNHRNNATRIRDADNAFTHPLSGTLQDTAT